jgi:hypothetical protein
MNVHDMLIINAVPKESIDRIFKKIKIDENGCWNWCGSLNRGYGEVRVNKKLYRTHRFMYAWLVDSIPSGKSKDIPVLDHICNNRACCNPAHLRLTSDTENILKGNGATARKHRQTHCQNGHLLPPPIRGHRRCMICHREWNKRNYAKNPMKFILKIRQRRLRLSQLS